MTNVIRLTHYRSGIVGGSEKTYLPENNTTLMLSSKISSTLILIGWSVISVFAQTDSGLQINDQEYFELPGLNVMAYHDYYAVGHQSGVTIIQNGSRVVANGDVRLWPLERPYPDYGIRIIDAGANAMSIEISYNDSSRQQYNDPRFVYPPFNIKSKVTIKAEGAAFRITVDLEEPLPASWQGKLGFSMELFPGQYFDRSFYMDNTPGIFPRSMNGPVAYNSDKTLEVAPIAKGRKLVVLPESPDEMITFESFQNELELVDGRVLRNNGWFVLRSPLKTGVTTKAAEWLITPSFKRDYKYAPVIQVSQVGYKPAQGKIAVIEMDGREVNPGAVTLQRINESGGFETVKTAAPVKWGKFLRYQYARFDFTEITRPGMYRLSYGSTTSQPFKIHEDVYKRHVWQPTLEYYLPAQMCHMRVNDRLKVWHGLCHEDDALMAPISHVHFDSYVQGPSTYTKFKPGEPVPGINVGGWHDAGDYDLRVESQANTVRIMAYAWELFRPEHDETTILQDTKVVEMHVPDGVPDLLQQIEHGVLSIAGGYNSLGRLYRGIICNDPRQYSLLGDGSIMTDNLKYDASLKPGEKTGTTSSLTDDRWVFTEDNPRRELDVAACLTTAYRSLKGYNDALANNSLEIALAIWQQHRSSDQVGLVDLAVELFLTTGEKEYADFLTSHQKLIADNIGRTAAAVGRLAGKIDNKKFNKTMLDALTGYAAEVSAQVDGTPYGVNYRPNIWGDGWNIQRFGVSQYFLHKGYPMLFPVEPVLNAMNFVLGVHPGANTASFVSAVGAKSLLVAYGTNRDEWSYIPGGSASGTALIRPDLPELKEWPYFWQQTEYVMGGGATNYMFLVLAADNLVR
jgi:endoglucanase